MTFMDFFEEASKIPGIDFRALSIMNLVNQNVTNSTNSIMAPDDNEIIRVWFKEDSENYTVDETFQKLFIKQAKDYDILYEYPSLIEYHKPLSYLRILLPETGRRFFVGIE